MADQSLVLSNPSAGTDWVITHSQAALSTWNLKTVHAKIVTDANVATRQFLFTIRNAAGVDIFNITAAAAGLPASSTAVFSVAIGGALSLAGVVCGGVTYYVLGIPAEMAIGLGYTLRVTTTNIQVGDQWSQINATFN